MEKKNKHCFVVNSCLCKHWYNTNGNLNVGAYKGDMSVRAIYKSTKRFKEIPKQKIDLQRCQAHGKV